jgi:DNA-binding PadR family transcriptional regulator
MLKYVPGLKLLSWMHEKIRLEKIQGKRGKQRFQMKDDGKFSFTYKEGNYRGLSDQQFSRALRELHRVGFIEVHQVGSSRKKDFSIYSLSDRWKKFGEPGFEQKEFPTSLYRIEVGFRVGHDLLQKRIKATGKSKILPMRIHR